MKQCHWLNFPLLGVLLISVHYLLSILFLLYLERVVVLSGRGHRLLIGECNEKEKGRLVE